MRQLKKLNWLLYRIYFRYFPRFDQGLFHAHGYPDNPGIDLLLPGDSVTITEEDYLVEASFLNLFGLIFITKIFATYQIQK